MKAKKTIAVLTTAGCVLLGSMAAPLSTRGGEPIHQVQARGDGMVSLTRDTELTPISLYGGKLSISVPKDFAAMPEEMVRVKYANARQRPDVVYSNGKGAVSIAITHMPLEVDAADLPELKEVLEAQLKTKALGALQSSMRTVHGHRYIFFEFTSTAADTNIHNLMFATDLDGRLLVGTINCTHELLDTYRPVMSEMLDSIRK